MSNAPVPATLTLKESERLFCVGWKDGHRSDYPWRYLRGYCPCAGCQGHAPGPRAFISVPDPRVLDVRPVGRYALGILWSDGHDSGIYSFPYLRELCPCAECLPAGLPAAMQVEGDPT